VKLFVSNLDAVHQKDTNYFGLRLPSPALLRLWIKPITCYTSWCVAWMIASTSAVHLTSVATSVSRPRRCWWRQSAGDGGAAPVSVTDTGLSTQALTVRTRLSRALRISHSRPICHYITTTNAADVLIAWLANRTAENWLIPDLHPSAP